ncbi:DUF4493 domain-containing protein [Carboxylicivirga sp. A043]|uniref:DUF4493 domain-containing protein n=1 Tax=Carboxylicivirga litoralis TaxID=2816963 RepID=UPI0021CB1151|nr:DUF4493 domain-containing protein [Carboxylicivirga sp. A043]MCU4155976.1 DUF4493 domain-containing protein [Carboxylicivirga sp. A043]
MKTKLLSIALGLAVLSGCSNVKDDVSETGTLEIKCGVNTAVTLKSTAAVNPNDFIVKIKDGQDAVVKTFDPVSSAPDQVELMAGAYTVEALSEEFSAPAFDKPVYGGEVVVDVVPDQNNTAAVNCTQTNAGVKFLWTDEFKAAFSEYAAKVKLSDKALDFPKTEGRTGYFPAGDVSIDITIGTSPNDATYSKTFTLNAREVVTIKPVASDAGSGTLTVTITVDEDVTEREEVFVIGTGGNGGGSETKPLIDEDFESGTDGGTAAINGWSVAKVQGDRDWQIKEYSSNKYVQASAHNGASADYEYWLISPAIDMDNATSKILSFETAKAYWKSTSSLEVFVMDGIDPATANVEKIDAKVAAEGDADHTFISSGNIDLATQTGTKYIGFKYVAKGGQSNSTTFRIDNVKFGEGSTSGGGDTGGDDTGGDDTGGGSTGSEVLAEDFADCTGTVDNSPAWNGNASFPTVSEKVYATNSSVKLGSSSTAGSIETKALDLSGNGGAFAVSFKVKGWSGSYDTKVVVACGSEEQTLDFTSTGKDGDYATVSANFTNGQASSTIVVKNALKTDPGYEGKPMRVIIDNFKVTQ